jgi:hypothetical protein
MSDITRTARSPSQDFMQATPRNQGFGYISDLLAATYGEKVLSPIQFIAKAFGAEAMSKTLNRMSYGEPLTTGAGGIGGTTKVRPEAIEAAMIAAPMLGKIAQVTKGMPAGMSIRDVSPPEFDSPNMAQAMMLRDIGADPNTIYKQTGIWLGE